MRRQRGTKSGFTLLEISIVLIIFSIIIGGGFAAANRIDNQRKRDITAENLDRIEQAMMAYRTANNRLPCPANGLMNPDDPLYGKEAANPDPNNGTCTGGSPAANFIAAQHATITNPANGNPIPTRVVGGMVPVITLGLAKKYALDGWGNKISYHIDAQATESQAFSSYTPSNGKCFNVMIDDEKTWAADNDRNYIAFHAVYALLSHGKDGHGAFSQGGPRISKASTNSYQNINGKMNSAGATTTYTNQFFMVPPSESPTDEGNRFDDVVRYKTRADLRTSQDSPAMDFPDLMITTDYGGGVNYKNYFYFRCKDRFIMEQSDMVDLRNQRTTILVPSPNNEYIVGGSGDIALWTYDGTKTVMLPNNTTLSPYPAAGNDVRSVAWAPDGSYFIAGPMGDFGSCTPAAGTGIVLSACNRFRVYERTGMNKFTAKDKAFYNYRATAGDSWILDWHNFPNFALRPDGEELLLYLYYENGGRLRAPTLFRRNPDNTFMPIPNAFDPALPSDMVSREPEWTPDGRFLIIPGGSDDTPMVANTDKVYIYRNDGNNHYSQITTPSPFNNRYARGMGISPNSRFLVMGRSGNGIWGIYQLQDGDTWTQVSMTKVNGSVLDPATKYFPSGGFAFNYVADAAFSPDGRYLAVGTSRKPDGIPVLVIFKIEGDNFTQLEAPDGPDFTPLNEHVMSLTWRRAMPWEKTPQ